MSKIVYLQTNESIAETFREEFSKNGIEMLTVKSGEEALSIIAREKVLLLLLDINIPDMRFRKLVDRIRAVSPQVIINVCVDVLDPLMITKLSNRHHVHKIYVAPWDVDSIIEEVKESLEVAVINEQINVREEKINSEIKDLETTIESLKDTLRKQQHSYSKLVELTDCFIKPVSEQDDFDDVINNKMAFAVDAYTTILKMQTTGAFDIEKFEEDIRKDLREIKGIAPLLKVGTIENCIFDGTSRAYIENIRFCIFLLARLHGQFYEGFCINMSSHYITTKEAEFCVYFEEIKNMNFGNKDTFDEYLEFVKCVISDLGSDLSVREEAGRVSYVMTLPVARD